MVQDLSSVKFYSAFQHFKKFQIDFAKSKLKKHNYVAKKTDSPDSLKIVELFSRTLLKDREPESKIYIKIALFLDIKTCQAKLSESNIRLWLKDNLHTLMQDLIKLIPNDYDVQKIIDCFKEKIQLLNKSGDTHEFLLPKGLTNLHPKHLAFKDPIYFKESSLPLDTFTPLPSQVNRMGRASDSVELTPPELKSTPHLPFLFMQQFKTCEYLSKISNFPELRYEVLDTFETLKKMDGQVYWDTLSPQEKQAWSTQIHQLTGYLYQAHFGANIKCPTSIEISNILKALSICVKLAQQNDHNTVFGSYSIDMSPFRDILKDNYLNLSIEGPEIP